MDRCILVQGQVRALVIVAVSIEKKNPREMTLAEDHDVIEVFATHRADEPFGEPLSGM